MSIKKLLSTEDLQLLSNLIGRKYVCLVGSSMMPTLNTDSFYLVAEGLALSIWGDFDIERIGADEDEFSFFRVEIAQDSEIAPHRAKGEVSFRHSGDEIIDISFARLSMHQIIGENKILVFETDRTIVIRFSGGSLALSRRSLHLEMIEATFSEGKSQPVTGKISTHYSENDEEVFEITETMVPLTNAIG